MIKWFKKKKKFKRSGTNDPRQTMRKCAIFLLSFITLGYGHSFAQGIREKRHVDMIKFLINHQQLTNVGDSGNLASCEGYMFDRVILKKKRGNRSNNIAIYVFGSNSPHGKEYIALEDITGLKLIETKDMPKEIKPVLDFFKRNSVSNEQIVKSLATIADTYQHNTIVYRSRLEN